jgi:hypothetical protein
MDKKPCKRAMKSPSERAAEHAQRMKDLQARRQEMSGPGPGSYEPSRPKSASDGSGSSSAFKSSSDRLNKPPPSTASPSSTGDPGSYDPSGHLISHRTASARSFQVASRKGQGSFGGTSRREFNPASVRPVSPARARELDESPGPGTHDPQCTENGKEANMCAPAAAPTPPDPEFLTDDSGHCRVSDACARVLLLRHVLNGSEKMKSAAFANTTKRRGVALPSANVSPGPQHYTTNFSPIEPRIKHTEISKTGRDHKYASDTIDVGGSDSQAPPHLGPGAYSPLSTNKGSPGSIALNTKGQSGGMPSASMISDSVRTKLDDLW